MMLRPHIDESVSIFIRQLLSELILLCRANGASSLRSRFQRGHLGVALFLMEPEVQLHGSIWIERYSARRWKEKIGGGVDMSEIVIGRVG